jgi:excisionase family DNA binding protein
MKGRRNDLTENGVDSRRVAIDERAAEESLLVTTKEAAQILQISRTKVYELIYANELISVKIGSCRRIRRQDLEDFVECLTGGS